MADSNMCPAHSGMEKSLEKLCLKIEALEKLCAVQFEFINKETKLAKEDMERRLEGMNEFRAQLNRQASEFVTRESMDLKLAKLETKIESTTACMNISSGSGKWQSHIVTVLIAMAVMLVAHYVLKL